MSLHTELDTFQQEHWEWVVHNFDATRGWDQALAPFAGVVEEFSEFHREDSREDGYRSEHLQDAAADAAIYLTDLCSRLGISLAYVYSPGTTQAIRLQMTAASPYGFVVSRLGKLAHAILKSSQNIRMEEDHLTHAKEAIQDLFFWLNYHTPMNQSHTLFHNVVFPVWEKVKLRNWKPERETGDTSQRNAE